MLENNCMLIFTLKTSVGCIVKVRLFADHLPAYLSEELRCDWHLIRLSPGFLFFKSQFLTNTIRYLQLYSATPP